LPTGGQFVEQVSHTVDLVRYVCGEAAEVFMHAVPPRTFNREVAEAYTIDDAAMLSLRFRRGGVADIWSSCAVNAGGGVSLTVHGSRHTAHFTAWEHHLRLVAQGAPDETIPGEPDIFALEDREFLAAVADRDPGRVATPYPDGVKTLELILAAEESARTGRSVRLD
jgi:predicted dehydrogenase